MSLNVGEASAVNVLAKHLAREPSFGNRPIPHDDAVQALAALADNAHKRLQAGVTGAYVKERWQQHTPNGYDPRWVDAVNDVLRDRGSDARLDDLDDDLWERFIGPLVDHVEDR